VVTNPNDVIYAANEATLWRSGVYADLGNFRDTALGTLDLGAGVPGHVACGFFVGDPVAAIVDAGAFAGDAVTRVIDVNANAITTILDLGSFR